MKVLGINGSPRKGGNTDFIIKVVFEILEKAGIETEIVQIGGKILKGCNGCMVCFKTKDNRCVIDDDGLNDLMPKLKACDGILLASPTYFSDVTPEMKAFMDRAGFVSNANGGFLIHKAGAAITAVRRGGAQHTLDTMNHWLHYQQTYMVGSSYWNMVICREIGEATKDEEGMKTMKTLGHNMLYLFERLIK
jgi:multimeric flavodoxin WrbA